MWSGKKTPSKLDRAAYSVLEKMGAQIQEDSTQIIRDHTGKPIPQIIASYLAGTIDSAHAWRETQVFLDVWNPTDLDSDEQQQVKKMLEIFFNPNSL